jgi:type I restriction enzyme S subunit
MTRLARLAEVVVASTGTRNPTAQPDAEFTYVDVAAVDNHSKVIAGARTMRGADAPSRARKVLRTGDVIVSTVRPNLNAVALVPEVLDGQIGSTGFCVLRAKRECVLPEYLFYFSRSKPFVDGLVGLVSGALYPAVTDRQVLDQTLPIPALGEQRRIVDLLSRAEGIVRLRREAQAKVQAIIPALFLDTFGDPRTNPKGWPVVALGEALRAADYGSSTKASEAGTGLPLIRMGNVTYAGDLDLADLKCVELDPAEVERYRLVRGDILFNRTNSKELVGKTGLWDIDLHAVAASYFIRLRVDPSRALPFYVWAFMNSRHIKRVLFDTARGAIGQANINSKELKALRVPLPPLEAQTRFEDRCRSIRSVASQQTDALLKAEAAFLSLLTRAFSGKHSAEHAAEEAAVA